MIADLVVTSKGRQNLLRRSLESLEDCTDRSQYRLTLVLDSDRSDNESTLDTLANAGDLVPEPDHLLIHRENLGLGPSLNQALAHVDMLKKWDGAEASPLTVYVQDDVLYSSSWLSRLSTLFLLLEKQHNLGFASGIAGPEHSQTIRQELGLGVRLQDWIRATCMMARHDYWMSMLPISRIDPETNRERGKPNDGVGSSVDWWFIRNHRNSVCRTGRTNLVIPGLLRHIGYRDSTWLDRELPETDEDKRAMDA